MTTLQAKSLVSWKASAAMPHPRLGSDELGSICQQLGGIIKQESSSQASNR